MLRDAVALASPLPACKRPATQLDCAEEMVGTVSYMPPEQLSGGHVGPAADIFSLGAVLHALLHGRLPWGGDSMLGTIRQRLECRPDVYEAQQDLAPSLNNILSRCLAHNPNDRFANAEELARALRAEVNQDCAPANPR